MKIILSIILLLIFSSSYSQCSLSANFYFNLDGDSLRFHSFSYDDLSPEATYAWTLNFYDGDDPVTYEGESFAILQDEFETLIVERRWPYVSLLISDLDECGMAGLGIFSGTESGCTNNHRMYYTLDDLNIKFISENLTDLEGCTYEWRNEGILFSTDEDPIELLADFPERTDIELTISHVTPECSQTITETIYTTPEGDCADSDLSFYAINNGDSTTFYNTSENIYAGGTLIWSGESIFSDSYTDDSITFPNSYLDTLSDMCLQLINFDEFYSVTCYQYLCSPIVDLDTLCSLSADFDLSYDDGVFFFENTSTGTSPDVTFEWYLDGLLSTDEDITLDLVDVSDGDEICFYVTDLDGICRDTVCQIINLETDTADCTETIANFDYFKHGDSLYVVNTSDDIVYGAEFTWNFNGEIIESSEDTVVFLLEPFFGWKYIRLDITYPGRECNSYRHESFTYDGIPDLPCRMLGSFSHIIVGDSIAFTSIITDPAPVTYYHWYVDGALFSNDRNPSLYRLDLDPNEYIRLFVTDSLSCHYSESQFIVTERPTACDSTEANFYYTVEDEFVTFYNTSDIYEDEVDAYVTWILGGSSYSSLIDPAYRTEITRPVSDFEFDNSAELKLHYYYTHMPCNDSITISIDTEVDTTIYPFLMALFDYEMDGEYITFEPAVVGGSGPFAYEWLIDGMTYYEASPVILASEFEGPFDACLTAMEIEGSGSDTYCRAIEIETLGIHDVGSDLLTFYPNPADQFLNVKLGSDWKESYNIQIINLSGQIIQTIETNNHPGNLEVNVGNMSPGMYIIQVSTPNEVLNKRWKFTKM